MEWCGGGWHGGGSGDALLDAAHNRKLRNTAPIKIAGFAATPQDARIARMVVACSSRFSPNFGASGRIWQARFRREGFASKT